MGAPGIGLNLVAMLMIGSFFILDDLSVIVQHLVPSKAPFAKELWNFGDHREVSVFERLNGRLGTLLAHTDAKAL